MYVKKVVDTLLESESEIGIAVLDCDTRVLLLNEKVHDLYQAEPGTVLSPKTRLQQIASLSIQQRKGVAGIPIRETVRGNSLHLLLYTFPHLNEGNMESLTILFCDISPLHHSYQVQKHQEKLQLVGSMAASMANVILNPLAVVKGTVQLIEQSVKKDIAVDYPTHPLLFKLQQYFNLIDQQVREMDGTIKRFLMLGKPTELKFESIAVVPFLQRFVLSVQKQAMQHNISLICEYPHCQGEILVNEHYMQEALHALVQNALEATPEGGRVLVKTDVDDRHVRFSIVDFGSGISPTIIENVKEPFYTTKEEALGFGLSFCDEIVKKMGGTLEIKSDTMGTQAIINLPKIVQ